MYVQLPYHNRRAAGCILAQCLSQYRNRPDVVTFGLFRGGVPVAYEVALTLNIPLAVCFVRKLCAPEHPELAIGAVASGGVYVLNPAISSVLAPQTELSKKVAERELRRCEKQHQILSSVSSMPFRGKKAILTDDGLATGTTMHAAIRVIRLHYEASGCIVAAPVGSSEACSSFQDEETDEVICPATPSPFYSVSQFYRDFRQITDEEVQSLLARAVQREHTKT